MTGPRVSICIPTFDGARFVESTVRSALAQTFSDFELIVADDGSGDDTVAIVRAIDDPRLRVIRRPATLGVPGNWNALVEEARAPLVKLLLQDDLLHPTCLERQVDAFDAAPDGGVVMVSSRRDVIDANGRVLVRNRGSRALVGAPPAAVPRLVVRSGTNIIGEPSVLLLRRDAVIAAGGFDGRESYFVDLELWLRLLERGRLAYVDRSLAAFRASAGSWSGRIGRDQERQARAFLQAVRRRNPGTVSANDLRIGTARAIGLAKLRRALYRLERTRNRSRAPT